MILFMRMKTMIKNIKIIVILKEIRNKKKINKKINKTIIRKLDKIRITERDFYFLWPFFFLSIMKTF